jgi:ATP-dependent Clp protease protease subunit
MKNSKVNHSPIRCFEGTAKPYEPFWRVRDAAESDSGEPEIEFYGYISEYSWWGDEITPAKFKADLLNIGRGGPVTVRIHSGGGEVWAASAIRAMLVDYPGRVTTRIDGLCASAATYIAMAGDRILMQDTAFFMIHDPACMLYGTVEDLKETIEFLKVIKQGIVESYQGKTGIDAEKLAKMMTDETWMTAQDAKNLGFVDEVVGGPVKNLNSVLQNAAFLNCLNGYSNVPEQVKGAFITENLPATPDSSEPVVDDEIQREARILRERVDQILRKE